MHFQLSKGFLGTTLRFLALPVFLLSFLLVSPLAANAQELCYQSELSAADRSEDPDKLSVLHEYGVYFAHLRETTEQIHFPTPFLVTAINDWKPDIVMMHQPYTCSAISEMIIEHELHDYNGYRIAVSNPVGIKHLSLLSRINLVQSADLHGDFLLFENEACGATFGFHLDIGKKNLFISGVYFSNKSLSAGESGCELTGSQTDVLRQALIEKSRSAELLMFGVLHDNVTFLPVPEPPVEYFERAMAALDNEVSELKIIQLGDDSNEVESTKSSEEVRYVSTYAPILVSDSLEDLVQKVDRGTFLQEGESIVDRANGVNFALVDIDTSSFYSDSLRRDLLIAVVVLASIGILSVLLLLISRKKKSAVGAD